MSTEKPENPNDTITGTVQTDKSGSGCVFDICERAEWEKMTEDQQQEALISAMWESGMIDVFPNTERTK